MRGSGWLFPCLALLLWLGAVGYPIVAAVGLLMPASADPAGAYVEAKPIGVLLVETTAYAMVIAVGAMMIGWAPGRWLGRALRGRGFIPLAVLMLFPICLPAYAVFYAWWQSWPAGTALHAWAVEQGAIQLLRQTTLVLGLLCWSWPIVAWCVAGTAAMVPAQREELLRLDGAGPMKRLMDHLRTDRAGLAIGGLLVFLIAFNNTTCFDLAQIFTFGNELRAMDAMGAADRQVLIASLPAIVFASIGAALIWLLLGGRPRRVPTRSGPVARSTRLATAFIWGGSVLVPIVLLSRNFGDSSQIDQFVTFYGRGLMSTLILAAISGGLGVLVALGLSAAWMDHRPWVRGAAHLQAVGWLIVAVVPGTIIGVALEAAYNVPRALPGSDATLADVFYRGPLILILGHLARFGFVAALLGRMIAAREPAALADLRRQDGAGTLTGLACAAWPRLLAAGVASAAIILVLSLSELPVTARVHPPGSDPLAVSLLNAMHYQRPETVTIALAGVLLIAACAALLTVLAWAPIRRIAKSASLVIVFFALLFGMTGCTSGDPSEPVPLKVREVFGSTGTALGQFAYPRCIDVDRRGGYVYVIDKTARVQRFSLDGEAQLQWRMPKKENGKPTGVSVAPDGRVFVADTHYYRVIAYDRDGNELMRFGEYGEGPGQFIYSTDIAFGPEGRLYVAEYGGNDRIQVFSGEGEFLFAFGSFGEEPEQFNRPQSIVFNEAMTELFVADSCNHRISVFDPEGRLLRSFGTPGFGPGELHYPYGLAMLDDGSLMVSEFGNNRIQLFAPDGRSCGLFGRLGAGEGELRYPWGVSAADGNVFVLDSGNNRVQMIRAP